MADRSVHVRVTGRVQGVGFRAWTERQAKARHLSGWVRNTVEGHVEAVFSGAEADIAAMLEECRHGPGGAWVTEVVRLGDASPETGPFRILTNR